MRVTRRGSQELFAIPPAVSSHGFVGTRDLLGSHASWPRKFDPQLAPGPEAEEGVLVGVRAVLQDQGAHIAYYHRQYYHRQPTATATTTSTYYRYHYDHYDRTIMSLRHELVLSRWKAPCWHRSRPSCWHSMGSEISS